MNYINYQAIIECLYHWTRIRDGRAGKYEGIGPSDCALCKIYLNPKPTFEIIHGGVAVLDTEDCEGCPIYEREGLGYCRGTPYYDINKIWRETSYGYRRTKESILKIRQKAIKGDVSQPMVDYLDNLAYEYLEEWGEEIIISTLNAVGTDMENVFWLFHDMN